MTGFGRGVADVAGQSLVVELRSVNHRHSDVSVRLPRTLSALEPELRRSLSQRFSRGKLDVSVAFGVEGRARPALEFDRELAQRYLALARDLVAEGAASAEIGAAQLLALPGVARVVEQNLDEAAVRGPLLAATEQAACALEAMRAAEGEALARELRARVAEVSRIAEELSTRAGEVVKAVREKLRRRTELLRDETGLLDEARLHQEVVIAADRLDITEELVRVRSHVLQVQQALEAPGPVGRRLEFLLQEMGREANTIGSKCADAPAAHRVVDLKTELERLREQALNVE